MSSRIDHPRDLRPNPFALRGALLVAMAASPVACGDDGGGDTGEYPPPEPIKGYVVDCLPDDDTEPLVCMSKDDFNCSQNNFYVKQGICALVLHGTPSRYIPALTTFDPDGNGPEPESAEIVCNPDLLPAGILSGYGVGSVGCSECQVCIIQSDGFLQNPDAEGPIWWNELPWCPSDMTDLEAFCADGDLPPPDPPEPPPAQELWRCTGSGFIDGVRVNLSDPQDNVTINMSPEEPPYCVTSSGITDAYADCKDHCEAQNVLEAGMLVNLPGWEWDPYDCNLFDGYTPTVAVNPLTDCHGMGPVPSTTSTPFSMDARLTTPVGEATGAPTGGLMGITPPPPLCKVGPCEISIDDLRSDTITIQGTFTPVDAPSVPLVVQDLRIRLLQPVRGEFDPNTNAVSFPVDQFFAVVSTSEVTLDGTLVARDLEEVLFVVSEATGEWNGTSLSLELVWELGGVELGLSLNSF